MLILPPCPNAQDYREPLQNVGAIVAAAAHELGPGATLITLGEIVDLVHVQANMSATLRYQHCIAIKRTLPKAVDNRSLPNFHFGALIHTRYGGCLRHTKTRIKYTYCPACNKTTRDYGGKKHTYHEYGTLMSDVWRDIKCDLEGDLAPVVGRFRDLLGVEGCGELRVLDCRQMRLKRGPAKYEPGANWTASFALGREGFAQYGEQRGLPAHPSCVRERQWALFGNPTPAAVKPARAAGPLSNQILQGDCLERLADVPDCSIDFVFADPPYNLRKKYSGYSDDREIEDYFGWCDRWIAELARVLKPGRTCAILNIPLWAIRHFLFLDSILQFQNWIAWDALAFPVRLIMPAHYVILAFSKGEPRELPGLVGQAELTQVQGAPDAFRALEPLAQGYCLRSMCVKRRRKARINDRGPLTDLWWDIHRLKHNSRRVDHPTQLPPHLMYRLICIFTKHGEIVLDCFNGAGTTTLAAEQLGREYIGIEKSKKYCDIAGRRHEEMKKGLNPFRKAKRKLTAKNSPVPRVPDQRYEIPKKTLQLEVKRVANQIGHLPSRAELAELGKYPIKYYDQYFVSWGEVCAAARTTGMSEVRPEPRHRRPSLGARQSRLRFRGQD